MNAPNSFDVDATNIEAVHKTNENSPKVKTLTMKESEELKKIKALALVKSKSTSNKATKATKVPTMRSAKTTPNVIVSAMQLAINYSLSKQANLPFRDILTSDFYRVNIYVFPSSGSTAEQTPPHPFTDFSFEEYSPVAFRYFRDIFGIRPEDFMNSLCGKNFKQLSNSGASGSLFYISSDDLFVVKTVDSREAKFLQQLLPGYYMNLHQNPNTLLPKFFGSYHYKSITHNFRVLVMNNLLPSDLTFCEKYDIKGSTYKRRASDKELEKAHPTLKDLDFIERHPRGLLLDDLAYDIVISTLARDARVLQSFKIMDYSLLLGIHRLSATTSTNTQPNDQAIPEETQPQSESKTEGTSGGEVGKSVLSEPLSTNSQYQSQYQSQTVEPGVSSAGISVEIRHDRLSKDMRGLKIQQDNQAVEEPFLLHGGIPAKDENGNNLLLFIGIIDILQNFRLAKKLEYQFKSIFHDGKTISVNKPSFYQDRFLEFCKNRVFKCANQTRSNSIYDSKGFTYHNHRKFPTQRYDQHYINNISLASKGVVNSQQQSRVVIPKITEIYEEEIAQPLKVAADDNIESTQN